MQFTLREQLTLYRRRRGFSQDELGELAGISGATVGRIETGEASPRIDQLAALARALGLVFEISLAVSPQDAELAVDQGGE